MRLGVGGSLLGFGALQLAAKDAYGFVRSNDCAGAAAGSVISIQTPFPVRDTL